MAEAGNREIERLGIPLFAIVVADGRQCLGHRQFGVARRTQPQPKRLRRFHFVIVQERHQNPLFGGAGRELGDPANGAVVLASAGGGVFGAVGDAHRVGGGRCQADAEYGGRARLFLQLGATFATADQSNGQMHGVFVDHGRGGYPPPAVVVDDGGNGAGFV